MCFSEYSKEMIKLLLKLSHHQQKPKMCFYVYLSASIAYYKSF